jgi:hypothetical protein
MQLHLQRKQRKGTQNQLPALHLLHLQQLKSVLLLPPPLPLQLLLLC